METAAAITFVFTLLGSFLASHVICALKGKWFFALCMPFTIVAVIGAIRLAKPRSWWARRYYAPPKLARATERFEDPDLDLEDHELAAAWEGIDPDATEMDRTTRRALRKASRR